MKISFTLNGIKKTVHTEAGENVQALLQRLGIFSVRDSDDHQGFCGSDTIILNGKPVNAGLFIAAQIDGADVKTIESVMKDGRLSAVQSAMVDCGLVQSGYNSPAAALMLTDLLERIPDPSKDDIMDALSPLFSRSAGYQPFFKAVDLAKKRMKDPSCKTEGFTEFREDLREVGKVRRKIDGHQLVAGHKAFVEDMVEPGTCILKMLQSPHAHAYITSIDTAEAEKVEGVVTIITHKNCPDVYYTNAGQGAPEPSPHDRKLFNQKVLYVGDRVAAVVAETEEAADEALKKIKVEYEVLKPVFTWDDAQAPDAPILHKSFVTYGVGAPEDLDEYNKNADPRDGKIHYPFPLRADPHHNLAASVKGGIGDMEKGFKEADIIIDRTFATTQIQCTPTEPHVVFTKMQGDRLVIHASTQVPFHLRRVVAKVLGIPETKIHVIKERVGGGFGSKQDVILEDVAAFATYSTGRPVYYRYTRNQEFNTCSTRKPMRVRVKIGAKKDGTFTAIQMDNEANTGPFGAHALTVPMNACSKNLPLFLCPNMYFTVRIYYSNIMPTGAYQGYGAPKGAFALNSTVAELAEQLGMDQIELMRKNMVREGAVLEILRCLGEGREGTPALVQSCGLEKALEVGSKMIDWGKEETSDDPDIKIGKGVSIIQQGSGLPGLDHSNAHILMLADGGFSVHSGAADIGTGLDTVMAKVVAEVLEVPLSKVTVMSGDTDHTPFDTGAYASSGTFFSGNAARLAAEDMKQKILQKAAEYLSEPVEDCVLEYPAKVKGKNGEITYAQIAYNTTTGHGSGQLQGIGSFITENHAIPYGANFAEVAVNTRTGEIDVRKFYALLDCGTPINPELAEGQVFGGVLKSIGHSLYEGIVLDKNGKPLNDNLQDYNPPTIYDLPKDFQAPLVFTKDPDGPYGGKSISELATNGAAPALAIAIHNACGVWIREWPFTPEKILKGLGKI
ncbi:MAG: molybdopterin-dependent oxidoreductase Mo/Fe-S-binding subunit [Alphaproteobacteria bacterium]